MGAGPGFGGEIGVPLGGAVCFSRAILPECFLVMRCLVLMTGLRLSQRQAPQTDLRLNFDENAKEHLRGKEIFQRVSWRSFG